MMHLVLGLFAEGPTDRRALPAILTRTAIELLRHGAARQVDVQEQVQLFPERENAARAEVLCKYKDEIDLFAVHADGRHRRRAEIGALFHDDIRRTAAERCAFEAHRLVELIPSPELEGWLLADPDAIARSLGFVRWPAAKGFVCAPFEIETLADAKRTLDEAVNILTGSRAGAAPHVEQIASEIDLMRLARLASYQSFRSSLQQGLAGVGAFR